MKFKTLGSVVLLASLGVVIGAPSVSHAESVSSQTSTGTLNVEQGTLDPGTGGVVDPENPGGDPLPTNPEGPIVPNPDAGSKGIMGVSNLDFGTIKVGTKTASAAAITVDGKERGNIVSFGDVTGAYTGYTITGTLTQQFTNATTKTVLDGSTIAFTNPILETSGVGTIAAAPATNTLELNKTQTFVTANTGEGSGKWSLEFGQSAEYNSKQSTDAPSTTANSVNLAIPANVANSMTTGTYTAIVTWSMDATA